MSVEYWTTSRILYSTEIPCLKQLTPRQSPSVKTRGSGLGLVDETLRPAERKPAAGTQRRDLRPLSRSQTEAPPVLTSHPTQTLTWGWRGYKPRLPKFKPFPLQNLKMVLDTGNLASLPHRFASLHTEDDTPTGKSIGLLSCGAPRVLGCDQTQNLHTGRC